MSNDNPECAGGALRQGLLAWARKRKGYVIGGRELLRQMEKSGCTKCPLSNNDECECDATSRHE